MPRSARSDVMLACFFSTVRQAAGKPTMAGLVAHGWGNAFVPLFPTIVMAEGAAQQRYWIWAGLTLLAGALAMTMRRAAHGERNAST